ncbi:MAG: undecaprenyl-diphosphate phosphatase [Arsenophonus endosymbiont of Ceratovacuna japonica]
MLNNINLILFNFINSISITSTNMLILVTFISKRLIFIFPLITISNCFWGGMKNLLFKKIFICKTIIAIILSLFISFFIGITFPRDRPFVLMCQHFFIHAMTPSFPSNHATIAFTFAFSFLFWLKKWIGILLFIPAFLISWARIFLRIHWPLDIIGALLVSIVSCIFSQIIWNIIGYKLIPYIIKYYQILFSFLIKKGWIKY